VGINDLELTVDGEPFRFIGANAIYFGFYHEYGYDIEEAIRSARDAGITVMRIYVWLGDAPWGGRAITEYDRVLDIAAKHDMYLIITLTDCCPGDWGPNKETYFEVVPHCDLTNPSGVSSFKQHIKSILNRKNTVNGKIYKDDSTILAWDVANELVLGYFSSSEFSAWLNDVVPYIKELDPHHLVTLGIQDPVANFTDGSHPEMLNIPGLDFFSIHIYPTYKQGQQGALSSDLNALRAHVETYLSFGKPVVLEEFGVGSQRLLRNPNETTLNGWVQAYRDLMDTAFTAGASGAMFWGWGVPETKNVPEWWNTEDHDPTETEFIALISEYKIPPYTLP